MSRAVKNRRVCGVPGSRSFIPDKPGEGEALSLTVEELEALRLCDMEAMDQDAAARNMDVSRGTFQRILYSARRTVARALWEGRGLVIGGGNYVVAKGCCRTGGGCGHWCLGQEEDPWVGME